MLVHLVVPGLSAVVNFDLFVSAQPMSEQPQIPTGKITAVVDPAAEEPEAAIQIKSVYIGAANRMADFVLQLGCDSFVGIHDQHPFMLPGNTLQRQFFFRGRLPFQMNCTTRAPAPAAIAGVPSVLAESTTTISSANETPEIQSRTFAASFLTGISTDKGAFAIDKLLIE